MATDPSSFDPDDSPQPGEPQADSSQPETPEAFRARQEAERHARWMAVALREAETAATEDEVPVGAAIVRDDVLLAVGRNRRERDQDPLAHAEMIAIRAAAAATGSWRLEECTLYVTLEPCPMCAGAILQARIPIVVYGADDAKAGAAVSLYELLTDPRLNHRCEVHRGIGAEASKALLQAFFRGKRALGKK